MQKENKNKARAHIIVEGQVQGVFFRANTDEKARELGLTGWVRNTQSGGVEAVFEGEKEKIEEMLVWVKNGPPGAEVKTVDVKWQPPSNKFKNFEIRY